MSTSKKHILTDELILGWIEGNLSSEESERVEKLIKSSDKYFSRFSTLYAAYKEMEEVELEVTPDSLIERANKEFGLKAEKAEKQNIFPNITEKIATFFTPPRLVPIGVFSTAFVVLMIVTLFKPESDIRDEDGKIRFVLSEKFTTRSATAVADNKLQGIQAYIQNDSLVIKQPIRFNRELSIISKDGELLLSSEFKDLENKIGLTSLSAQDSVIVKIMSLDTVVYEAVLKFSKESQP
tara:strand:+ start:351 stop:1064 length:714 start_codon:yes stop_codon:yes gene_type:complete